ncbi:T9SS type A sorting domain-containing protein [bacterium SCSIO 12741]|nr:T9SS type A sorting domain-containing protein [bacterium SCSIO 12741]
MYVDLSLSSPNVTSVDDRYEYGTTKIYPTMVTSELHVETGEFSTKLTYEVISLSGQVVIPKDELQEESQTLDVSALKPGKYYIRLRAGDNELKVVKPFIKH